MSPRSLTDTAIVLCGGRSRRMGRDKASLPFGSESMLARVARLVRDAVPDVVLVAREGQGLPGGLDAARDPAEGFGPLAAIAAGLAAVRADRAAVVACDTPLLRPAVVRRLLDLAGGHGACVPVIDGVPVPTCAVYRREHAGLAQALVAARRLSVLALIDRIDTRYVDAEELRDADPGLDSFRDCDTPEGYAAALHDAGLVVPVRVDFSDLAPPPGGRLLLAVNAANVGQALHAAARSLPWLGPEIAAGDGWTLPAHVVTVNGDVVTDPLAPVCAGDTVRLSGRPDRAGAHV